MPDIREKARAMFATILDDAKGRDLEKHVYNWTIATAQRDDIPQNWKHGLFRHRYIQKVISMKLNLTDPRNPVLRKKVDDGGVTLEWLVHAHPTDLFPEHWEPLYHEVAMKQLRKQLTEDIDTIPDGIEQCRRCKSRKVQYTQLQTYVYVCFMY